MGGGAAGNERRASARAPVPLAVGRLEKFYRRAARRDRRTGPGRDHQPDRPARRGLPPNPARFVAIARPGRDRSQIARGGGSGPIATAATGFATPFGDVGASRCTPERWVRAPLARDVGGGGRAG